MQFFSHIVCYWSHLCCRKLEALKHSHNLHICRRSVMCSERLVILSQILCKCQGLFHVPHSMWDTCTHEYIYVPPLSSFHLPVQPSVFWQRERLDGLEWYKGNLTEKIDEWRVKERDSWYLFLYIYIYICADPERKGCEDIRTYKPQSRIEDRHVTVEWSEEKQKERAMKGGREGGERECSARAQMVIYGWFCLQAK